MRKTILLGLLAILLLAPTAFGQANGNLQIHFMDVGQGEAVNAGGLTGSAVETTNENDLSVAAKVTFGRFDAEIGGT